MRLIRASVSALTLVLFATTAASAVYVVGKKGSQEREDDCKMQTGVCYRGCEGMTTTEWKLCQNDCEKLYSDCISAPSPRAPAAGSSSPAGSSGGVFEQTPSIPSQKVIPRVPDLGIIQQGN